MRDLVDTTEMYLRTVYELEEEGITPLRARIAERLEQSGPTVSQTVARMERDGLIVVERDRSLSLTPEGRKLATAVMRKHRLAERLLTDVLGLDIAKVHDEACRWEHVMSDEVERRVVAVLEDPTRSPFGNPIPSLEDVGAASTTDAQNGTRAVDLRLDEPATVKVVQISEILQQGTEVQNPVISLGALVGQTVTLTPLENGGVTLTTQDDETVELAPEFAHALRVELTK
ncbi:MULTISPECIES: metal-dependent transcriptional regulator [Corynebacterium]|mgnify:CR=1 FL=1|uniref:Diphtheria toxin repressor n=1 Tax=Corynebacterium riegelii TaxID=156976 RepID=A0A0K1R9Y8_9CORY|nr:MULTISPECIES: metal-dependent transcriptional regulator [Corynebacterium]AKV58242.1 toxin repressor [Corynebacterium riegelii]OFT76211.1 toxin repressor [Corynebacterium sp. HMSC30G07]QQU83715.1 metal-dependent transcriptional regulator [Corynebacterium riegelii]